MIPFFSRTSWGCCIAGLILASSALAGPSADAKIEAKLLTTLQGGASAPFFVVMTARPDIAPALLVTDREAKGRLVFESLSALAASSQAGVIAELQARGVPYRSYYIVNAVRVVGDLSIARGLAARSDVTRIIEETIHTIPQPGSGQRVAGTGSVEWNVAKVGADLVWNEFGITGEGIVVGNIDSGVDYLHPSLARSYRGNLGNGNFTHDYNWWDPAHVCPGAPSEPCDNVAHGTHTMGTMVGGDGSGPLPDDVGVAPGARWIAAKGCEDLFGCTEGSLLSAAQFMLAPTDRAGNNPDPSRRPHVVNNSWGGPGGDPFFHDVINAWRAAGIFPVFSAGNDGEFGCGTVGAPADDALAFAVGATDINDVVGYFSSRGPTEGGLPKPDVAAPGVAVRSTVPGGGFDVYDGTSMAAPHVAGVVALLWSGNPSLQRDIAATAAALRATAKDVIDLACGGDGDGDPNNTYGDGRLDAYAACLQYCGPNAKLDGYVRGASGGGPIAAASVRATRTSDGLSVASTSGPDGAYQIALPIPEGGGAESFDITFDAFGYQGNGFAVTAQPDETLHRNIRLTSLPRFTISGAVLRSQDLTPVANATVRLLDTPLPPQRTGPDGKYTFSGVPSGTYSVEATPDNCSIPRTRRIMVDGADISLEVRVRPKVDEFGHRCEQAKFEWTDGTESVPYVYPSARVRLPFPFYFYGQPTRDLFANDLGFLSVKSESPYYVNSPLPSLLAPNGGLYPFWDDLYGGVVRTATIGARPDRVFVIEYEGFYTWDDDAPLSFEVLIRERDSAVTFQYRTPIGSGDGRSATIGIENADGTDALQLGFDQPIVSGDVAFRLIPPTIDTDDDGVPEQIDVCPAVPDPAQADHDGDGFGDACDDHDGDLRPTSVRIFRATSDVTPNGRVVMNGEVLVRGEGDSLDVSDGLHLRVVDSLELAVDGDWGPGDCKVSRRGLIRCRNGRSPRDVVEMKPLPTDIAGFRTYLITVRLVQRDLDAPFVAPLRVTMTNAPRTPVLGIDRIGTPLDCEARSYGLECLSGRGGSTSRAFLAAPPSLFD